MRLSVIKEGISKIEGGEKIFRGSKNGEGGRKAGNDGLLKGVAGQAFFSTVLIKT